MHVRPARQADLPTLLRFEQGVIAAERPFNTDIRDETRYYDLAYLMSDALSQLLVAELDGTLVGCGYAQIRTSKAHLHHARHSYLGFMYVEPAYRGRGINQAIIERLLAWSREQGVSRSYLDVYAENSAAVRAYEKIGFTASLVEMKRPLD